MTLATKPVRCHTAPTCRHRTGHARLRQRSSLELPPVVAGLWRIAEWNLDVPARVRWTEQALDLGITSFDRADIYGDYRAETLFGEALKAAPVSPAEAEYTAELRKITSEGNFRPFTEPTTEA